MPYVPIGTGIIYAGMNDARVHDNWIFDNWRNGTMLLGVPDEFTSGARGRRLSRHLLPRRAGERASRPRAATSSTTTTWARRRKGFEFPKALDQFGSPHAETAGGNRKSSAERHRLLVERVVPATRATAGSTTPDRTAPRRASPAPADRATPPDMLPSDCASSVGPGRRREAQLPDRLRRRSRRGHRRRSPATGGSRRRRRAARRPAREQRRAARAVERWEGSVGGRGASRPARRAWLRTLSRGRSPSA